MIPTTKIGITGMSGVGKTDVILKVAELLEKENISVGGMVTRLVEEDGQVVGKKCENWKTGECGVYAHKDIQSENIVDEMGVNVDVLNEIGVKAIKQACQESDVVVIDEVEKKSISSEDFINVVKETMDSDKRIIITLHKRSRDPILQDIRRRHDIRILDVTSINKNLLPYKMIKILRAAQR